MAKGGLYGSTKKPFHKAYSAFIYKLASQLIELGQKKEKVATYLKAIPEWEAYQGGELKSLLEIERRKLGETKEKVGEDEPEDTDDYNKYTSHGKAGEGEKGEGEVEGEGEGEGDVEEKIGDEANDLEYFFLNHDMLEKQLKKSMRKLAKLQMKPGKG